MSVIQRLREKYLGVTVFIVVLALIGFLLMDSTSSDLSNLFRGGSNDFISVNGEEISQAEYNDALEVARTNYKSQTQSENIDESAENQIQESVTQELISRKVMDEEYDRLDLEVSDAELKYYMTSENASPQLKQVPAFTNTATGKFDGEMVKEYDRMVNAKGSQASQEDKQQWNNFKSALRDERQMMKYNSLLTNSYYVPDFFAEANIKGTQSFASADFVKIPYESVGDDGIEVTDADLDKVINSRKEMFKVKEDMRNAEFVFFPEFPSAQDTAAIKSDLSAKLEQMNNSTDPVAYINSISSIPVTNYYTSNNDITNPEVQQAAVGQVVGPYFDGSYALYTKILDQKMMPDSVKAQHILFASQGGKYSSLEQMQSLSDSVMEAIKSGSLSFSDAAAQFSDDGSNSKNGGELGYFGRNQMVPEFEDSAFTKPNGSIYTVKTNFGIHIVHIQDQKDFMPAKKLGNLALFFEASDATKAKVNEQMNQFVAAAKTPKDFDAEAKKQNLNLNVVQNAVKNSNNIQGIGVSREVSQWLSSHKKDDISDPIAVDNGNVILKITEVIKKGYMKPKDIRKQWAEIVVNDKKAKKIAKEIGKNASLQSLAAKYNVEVLSADSVIYTGAFDPVIGSEPRVIGYLFNKNFKNGSVSPAIAGNSGIFIVSKKSLQEGGTVDKNALEQVRVGYRNQQASRAYQEATSTLGNKAKIVDNVNKYY